MVLAATDLGISKSPVAIKLVHAARRTPLLEARFARETRLAAGLGSEHLARVGAFGHTDTGDPFIVMEMLSGRDLAAELAERGRLPIAEAVDAVVEACAGVAEAHAAGLLHRDLKPRNLFVTREAGAAPSIKVLDFGLAGVSDEKGSIDLTDTESDFGSPQYLAPEQIRASWQVDARTDQHALAAVLYELLTGTPPFTAPDVTRLAVAIAVDPPPHAREARPEVPPALDGAICRALAKRPDDRFPALLGFAEAVAPFGGERALAALEAVRALPAIAASSRTTRAPPARSPLLTLVSAVATLSAFGAYGVAMRCAPQPASAADHADLTVPNPPSPARVREEAGDPALLQLSREGAGDGGHGR